MFRVNIRFVIGDLHRWGKGEGDDCGELRFKARGEGESGCEMDCHQYMLYKHLQADMSKKKEKFRKRKNDSRDWVKKCVKTTN